MKLALTPHALSLALAAIQVQIERYALGFQEVQEVQVVLEAWKNQGAHGIQDVQEHQDAHPIQDVQGALEDQAFHHFQEFQEEQKVREALDVLVLTVVEHDVLALVLLTLTWAQSWTNGLVLELEVAFVVALVLLVWMGLVHVLVVALVIVACAVQSLLNHLVLGQVLLAATLMTAHALSLLNHLILGQVLLAATPTSAHALASALQEVREGAAEAYHSLHSYYGCENDGGCDC